MDVLFSRLHFPMLNNIQMTFLHLHRIVIRREGMSI